MKAEQNSVYDLAFKLKNAEHTLDAIAEFKRLIEENKDPAKIGPTMVAMLYSQELNDHSKALPYALQAVALKPDNQMASLCLVFCFFHAQKHDELRKEIERYIKTGGKLDHYQTLFEENGVTVKDFLS